MRLFDLLMHCWCSQLAASSSSSPSQAHARQIMLRTGAAFSPTPAVNTLPSTPPSAAASEAIWPATRQQNTSIAKRARGTVAGQGFPEIRGDTGEPEHARVPIEEGNQIVR